MTPLDPAAQKLWALLDEPTRARLSSLPTGLRLLGEAVTRSAIENLGGESMEWWHYLARRFPRSHDLEAALQNWRTDDLKLCYACGQGNPDAIAAFNARCVPVIDETLRRLRVPESVREEVQQQLLVELLVGNGERPATITNFLGLGKLEHWLRVVTARNGRRALDVEKRSFAAADLIDRLADPRADDGLRGAKIAYRETFRVALRDAIAALDPSELALLRQRFADGLSLQHLGAIYHVHHTTILRRLEGIQSRLLELTRRAISERLAIDEEELATIMHLIQSSLDVTLSTFLGPSGSASKAGADD